MPAKSNNSIRQFDKTSDNSSDITICIPTYNHSIFLKQCLDSLLAQTQSAAEIIVSDNHSTDDTATLLSQYGARVRVVSPDVHLDMVGNFNFCISNAATEWICILGSDDFVRPDYIANIQAGIRMSEDTDVVLFGGSEFVDQDGQVTERSASLRFPRHRTSGENAFDRFLIGPMLLLDSMALRRTAFLAVGGFEEKAGLHGDWSLFVRLSERGSFLNLRRYLSYKRSWDRPEYRGIRAEEELRNVLYIYNNNISSRLSGRSEKLKNKSVRTLQNYFRSIIRSAVAWGRDMEDFEKAEVASGYREALKFDGSVKSYIEKLEGPSKAQYNASDDKTVGGRVARRPIVRLAREVVSFALGWR